MKQRMQGMVIGVLVTVLFLGTITVWATNTRAIEATFGNYRTTLFGREFVARNAEGVILQPFSYNGSVYIPIESVLHAMDANAQWNEITGTLNFGTMIQPPVSRERTSLRQTAAFFDSGFTIHQEHGGASFFNNPSAQNIPSVNMGGQEFNNTTVYRSGGRNNQQIVNDQGLTVFTLHNLNGQYTLLTGYAGRVDASTQINATMKIIGDGRSLQTFELNATALPTSISVPIDGVRNLRIEFIFPRTANLQEMNAGQAQAIYAFAGFVE